MSRHKTGTGRGPGTARPGSRAHARPQAWIGLFAGVRPRGLSGVVCALVAVVVLSAAAQASAAPALDRGICLSRLVQQTPEQQAAILDEVAYSLRAGWIRLSMRWSTGEPKEGAYDEEYLAKVAAVSRMAADRGIEVLLCVLSVPRWASESGLWDDPPGGEAPGYKDYYVPRLDALPALRAFMKRVAAKCGTAVGAYECWNEPNLCLFLAPQQLGNDTSYAARRYVKMLAAFAAGVRSGAPRTVTVVGGSTSPSAVDGRWVTSPQTFFRLMKKHGAASYLDAVSHHPYMVGSYATLPPDRLPTSPDSCVAMANLGVLTRLFPGKQVFLTEFAYNVHDGSAAGPGVGELLQAVYLKQAYAYAARLPRVRNLFWYQLQDSGAWSTGLRDAAGRPRLSWYAFSGAARLTVGADPATVRRGGKALLSGRLTWSPRNGSRTELSNKRLVVERFTRGRWIVVGHVRTRADGAYGFKVKPRETCDYRVRWVGVASSGRERIRLR